MLLLLLLLLLRLLSLVQRLTFDVSAVVISPAVDVVSAVGRRRLGGREIRQQLLSQQRIHHVRIAVELVML